MPRRLASCAAAPPGRRRRWRCGARRCWPTSATAWAPPAPRGARPAPRGILLPPRRWTPPRRLAGDGPPAALAPRRASRYRAMLEAEAGAAGALRAPGWRRLHLADGRLREVPSGAAVPLGAVAAAPPPQDAVLPESSGAARRP